MKQIVFNVPDNFCVPGKPFLVESVHQKDDEVTIIGKEFPLSMLIDDAGSFIKTAGYKFEFRFGGQDKEDYIELLCDVVRRVKLRDRPLGFILFKKGDCATIYEFSPY